MTQEVSLLVFCVVLFCVWAFLVYRERKSGRRYFAAGLRGWLDEKLTHVIGKLSRSWEHFVKYILQLNWYYSIHSVLRAILRGTVAFYTYFENIFERNRSRTKQLRAERREISEANHLRQMTEHKERTALSPAQQRKLRKKKLEEKH